MTDSTIPRRQAATALAAMAVLILLLACGLFLSWREGNDIAKSPTSPAPGPIGKIAAWVEPPKPKQLDNSDRLRRTRTYILKTQLQVYERSLQAATRASAGEYSQRITPGVNSQSDTSNP
jgi:hypothetical protein